MKTIKIKYVGFFPGFDHHQVIAQELLNKHYNVEITEGDDADYVFCGVFGNAYEYCKYPQIRVMWSAENYIPDLNFVDYIISPYPIQLFDRCFQYPTYAQCYGRFYELAKKDRCYTKDILNEKVYFANFIASHESEYNLRGDFFKKLCEYKRVESPGSYLNNMPNGERVNWQTGSKAELQKKCKFTLCFESTKHEGFVTEKIVDAFYADTIPVYYGSDTVKEVFNEKAFINVADYPSFDAVIEKIKELDQDDEKYLEMLAQPILIDKERALKIESDLEKFLCSIIDQPYEKAYRRSRVYTPARYERHVRTAMKIMYAGRNALDKIKKFFSIPFIWLKRLFKKKK